MHRSQVTKLKDKLLFFRKSQTMRVLNQKLKRRDEQLEKLRAELRRNYAAVELVKTRRQLRKSQTQLSRLKMSTVTDTETAEMGDMKAQLQSLHERIKEMENEKLTLEDHMTVEPARSQTFNIIHVDVVLMPSWRHGETGTSTCGGSHS